MKRMEQLQKLSREHHASLVMAKRIAEVAEKGNDEELADIINTVRNYCDTELEEHFQHEERTIFSPIFKNYPELKEISMALLKEHGFLRMVIPKDTQQVTRKNLTDFALILKNHTRMEERELFPLVEKLFNEEQMNEVLNFQPPK